MNDKLKVQEIQLQIIEESISILRLFPNDKTTIRDQVYIMEKAINVIKEIRKGKLTNK